MSVILGSFSIIIMWYILLRGKSKTFYSKTKVLAKLLNLVLDWVLVDHCLSSSIIPNFFAGVHTFVRAHIFKVFKVTTTLSYLLHSWSVHKSLVHTAVPVFSERRTLCGMRKFSLCFLVFTGESCSSRGRHCSCASKTCMFSDTVMSHFAS